MISFEKAAGVPLDASSREATETDVERVCRTIARQDFCFLNAHKTEALLRTLREDALSDWSAFADSWNNMPRDEHMADGGRYRRRRHATLSALPSSRLFHAQPHQPHYQKLNYNPLNGGIARDFEPIQAEVLAGPTLSTLITLGCELFGRLSPYLPWHIEVHQFRIEAEAGGSGHPTPEGVHQDGVNFVIMAMVRRTNLVNGATTIYDRDKQRIQDFTLQTPLDLAIVNDERVYHGVTPIVQLDVGAPAIRDVLVITFRRKA